MIINTSLVLKAMNQPQQSTTPIPGNLTQPNLTLIKKIGDKLSEEDIKLINENVPFVTALSKNVPGYKIVRKIYLYAGITVMALFAIAVGFFFGKTQKTKEQ